MLDGVKSDLKVKCFVNLYIPVRWSINKTYLTQRYTVIKQLNGSCTSLISNQEAVFDIINISQYYLHN